MFFSFSALEHIPLSNVTVINFSKIFFIIPLAIIFLNEKTTTRSLLFIILGFIGVIFIIGFDVNKTYNILYYVYAILAAFLIAVVKILIKKFTLYQNTLTIQFWFSFFSCIFLFLPYTKVALLPNLKSTLMILGATFFGLLAQFFTINGLKLGKSTVVMPFDFFRVIFATLIGILLFSEDLTLLFTIGSFIIFLSGLQLARAKL